MTWGVSAQHVPEFDASYHKNRIYCRTENCDYFRREQFLRLFYDRRDGRARRQWIMAVAITRPPVSLWLFGITFIWLIFCVKFRAEERKDWPSRVGGIPKKAFRSDDLNPPHINRCYGIHRAHHVRAYDSFWRFLHHFHAQRVHRQQCESSSLFAYHSCRSFLVELNA